MPRLSASSSYGNASTSSLIKSAGSLQTAIANYQDQIQALSYANSAYTDDAYQTYQTYLQGRIDSLNSTGTVTNASKALTLTKTLEGAMHSNVSASITRENIQIMAGNATPQDKYNLIVSQYQRAVNNGDMTLAQTLENQAYSLSQTIQQQAQQAADAAATLSKAGNGTTTGTSGATYQGNVATNLTTFLKSMDGTAKNLSEQELNNYVTKYVNGPSDPNNPKSPSVKQQLNTLGVHIDTQQPTYWDMVYGIAGGIYNAKVLQAQAQSAYDPIASRTTMMEAQNMTNGAVKFSTLGGDMTVQDIQQAQQDQSMMIYSPTTGTYSKSQIIGYQYMNMDNGTGGQSPVLTPTYSGMASAGQRNQVYFLTPTETTMATKLGLSFVDKVNSDKTTGDGAWVQASENSPAWLQKIVGQNGKLQVYTDNQGFLTFKAGNPDGKVDANGQGDSFYTLATDDRGLGGLYQHLPDGSSHLIGGDYGFNGQAVQLLVNQAQQKQYQVQLASQQVQQQLKMAQQPAQQQALKMQQAAAPAPAAPPSQATRLQPAASPQPSTFNPQSTASPQPTTFNPQQTVNGGSLNQSGSGGIKLGSSSGSSIRLK